jgi:hypothetical protein
VCIGVAGTLGLSAALCGRVFRGGRTCVGHAFCLDLACEAMSQFGRVAAYGCDVQRGVSLPSLDYAFGQHV